MTKLEKARRIGIQLDALYPAPPIPLTHRDAYGLLVAVMLSAQTTDKKVNEVTPSLMARAPTPDAMSALTVAEILAHIRTLGLAPTKAKNLHALSAQLVSQHGGVIPMDYESLEALPGVGHKTAAVVRAQAFGIPSFPVDTHIHRLAARWGLSTGKNVVQTERDLKALFPDATWNRRHLQFIYFGREHCPALRHEQSACPICSWAAPRGHTRAATERKPPPRSRRR